MWKAATKTLVLAISLATFGTGCDLADFLDNIGDRIVNPEPEPEPLPEPDPDPVDPWMDCELALDECLSHQDGTEPAFDFLPYEDDCFVAFEECIEDIEPEPPVEPPTDPWLECEIQLDECLGGWNDDPDIDIAMPYPVDEDCFIAFEECIEDIEPEPPVEPDPWMECELQLDECLGGWDDDLTTWGPEDVYMPYPYEEDCFIAFEECIEDIQPPPPPVDDCDVAFEECIDSGVDPLTCELDYWTCWDPNDPVLACEIELEECLITSFNPDACFEAYDVCIDDVIAPPPVDPCDDAWIALEECIATGIDPIECEILFIDICPWPPIEPPVEPPVEPPYGECDLMYELCVNNGVDDAICDEAYTQCIDNNGEECGTEDPGYPGHPVPMD